MEKILVAVKVGEWVGLISYLYDWGYSDELIRQETAESLLHGIAANLEAAPETSGLSEILIESEYEDGETVRLNAYGEIDEMGELYDVHEITLIDCQKIIDQAKED